MTMGAYLPLVSCSSKRGYGETRPPLLAKAPVTRPAPALAPSGPGPGAAAAEAPMAPHDAVVEALAANGVVAPTAANASRVDAGVAVGRLGATATDGGGGTAGLGAGSRQRTASNASVCIKKKKITKKRKRKP